MHSTALNIASTLPRLAVAGTGMLVMVADALTRGTRKGWLGWLALLGLVSAVLVGGRAGRARPGGHSPRPWKPASRKAHRQKKEAL